MGDASNTLFFRVQDHLRGILVIIRRLGARPELKSKTEPPLGNNGQFIIQLERAFFCCISRATGTTRGNYFCMLARGMYGFAIGHPTRGPQLTALGGYLWHRQLEFVFLPSRVGHERFGSGGKKRAQGAWAFFFSTCSKSSSLVFRC